MKLSWKSFSLCKDGNSIEENEDAIFPILENDSVLAADQFTCAMADGATVSSFSQLWANLLVNEACQDETILQDLSRLQARAQTHWHKQLAEKKLPWHAEIKYKQGAYATLLWFTIWKQKGWMVNAIGDTCIFHFRKGRLITSYPMTRSSQFSNSPELISSNPLMYRAALRKSPVFNIWEKGDQFLIASDALSLWLLEQVEKGENGLQSIRHHLVSLFAFRNWITSLRKQSQIKNDDTSLILITVDE